MKNSNYRHYETGFTLVELMISLVLGLLISAAVMQIYITNVRTSTIQKGGSELQDASVFGLQQLESHLRLANLGNPTTSITDKTVHGGIVLTGNFNLGINPNATIDDYVNKGYLTRVAGDGTAGANGWNGISNVNKNSDQLTIQYRNTTGTILADCEGNDVDNGDLVVERYFLRTASSGGGSGVIKNLVLACDAGRIEANGTNFKIKTFSGTDQRNFGQAGQEFITGVDQFKVLLGTQSIDAATAGQMNYISSRDYLALTGNKPAITAIKVGVIVRGSTPIMGSEDRTDFTLLGENYHLKTDTNRPKQVRNTYESTTLLRNARIITIDN